MLLSGSADVKGAILVVGSQTQEYSWLLKIVAINVRGFSGKVYDTPK